MLRSILKLLLVIMALLICWFILHTLFILIDGLSGGSHSADLAVIFGNEINWDGQPSNRLKARLDKGIEVYNKQQAKILMVSGGIGKEGFDEAKIMAKYLIDHNIPEGHIMIDSLGNNTTSTAVNTKKIMDQKNFHSVIIISQYFHISRAKLAFKKAGIAEIYSAAANFFELRDLYSIPREFFAYYYYL